MAACGSQCGRHTGAGQAQDNNSNSHETVLGSESILHPGAGEFWNCARIDPWLEVSDEGADPQLHLRDPAGMTGAGLLRRLRYPGQADAFMGTETAEEHIASGAFQVNCERFLKRPLDADSARKRLW